MGTRASKARRSLASQEERHVGADGPAIEPKGATVGTIGAAAVTVPEDVATALSGAAAEAGGGDAEPEATLVMCSVCMDHVPQSAMFTLRCAHSYCHGCLHQYFALEVREGRTALRCPDCKATPTEPEISQVLGPELTERYLVLGLNRWLTQHPHARRCVGVNCDNAVLIGDLEAPADRRGFIGQLLSRAKPPCADVASRWECTRPGCGAEVCLRCGHAWHPAMSCEEVMALEDIGLTEDVIGGERGEVRPCPHCKSPIFKIEDGSCNHMICEACHKHFCWLCMKEVNDFHFLTPSGCTYFARQRWSLSKKALNQIAMAIVAPAVVGIGAAVSVPAIMAWLPHFAVKRTRLRLKSSHGASYHLSLAGAGAGAFLVSPIVAGVAVGLGVPAALILTYIVVPQYLLHEYIANKRRRDRERRVFLERQRRRATIAAGQDAAGASAAVSNALPTVEAS